MACTGHRSAGWPADLFGDRDRDRPRTSPGVPPAAASDGRTAAIDRALLDIDIAIPDHTTLSRRGGGLTILPKSICRDEPLHLLIDSTGLKIYGEGEWLDHRRGIRSPRRWRKLHLGVDADTHEVVAVELTRTMSATYLN